MQIIFLVIVFICFSIAATHRFVHWYLKKEFKSGNNHLD